MRARFLLPALAALASGLSAAAASVDVSFAPNTPYRLEVKVVRTHRGKKEMTVSCGGHVLGFVNDALPETFQAGIVGCEGRNRFHDFRIRGAK